MTARSDSLPLGATSIRARARDYLELTKPRITLLVVITALVGFELGATTLGALPAGAAASGGAGRLALLLSTLGSLFLVAGGANALNQFLERDVDARMRRTAARPLPAGRLQPEQALVFGTAISGAGVLWLAAAANPLAAALAALTSASYVLVYTPLKRLTPLSTLAGAVPGAMPPVLGWAAARGSVDAGAWALFAIMFIWQLPHFLAIAWLYRDDYARGALPMLSVVDPGGASTSQHLTTTSASLLPVSLAPAMLGLAGMVYFAGAAVLGLAFLALALRLARRRLDVHARRLFLASLVYLPVLFILLMLDRITI